MDHNQSCECHHWNDLNSNNIPLVELNGEFAGGSVPMLGVCGDRFEYFLGYIGKRAKYVVTWNGDLLLSPSKMASLSVGGYHGWRCLCARKSEVSKNIGTPISCKPKNIILGTRANSRLFTMLRSMLSITSSTT